jgi:2-methylisocitrate lyase-like PEP mutase family enzyme
VQQSQKDLAEDFLNLHKTPPLFVLANAWDVASARIFELAGFKAIGTTSAGIAATLGYPDGQKITVHETAEVIRRMARLVKLPISADIEAGYALTVEGVIESVRIVIEAGAVGINLEDSTGDSQQPLFDIEFQKEKITAIREMAQSPGIHLVINARTDAYMLSKDEETLRLSKAVERGNAYKDAGADCIFVPDLGDMTITSMKSLIDAIDAPINIIAGPNTPSVGELEEIGVRRVSLGPRHQRATFALLRRIAEEIMEKGTFTGLITEGFSYADVNRMFN